MPHPNLSRTNARHAIAVTLLGAAVLLPSAAAAQPLPSLGGDIVVCDEADDLLGVAELDESCQTVGTDATELAGAVADEAAAIAPQAVEPVAEHLPAVAEPAEPAPESQEPAQNPDAAAPVPPAHQSTAPQDEPTPAEVKAAGVEAEEVVEPAAPAADGRVDEGIAIAPSVSGTNIPGIRSQNGVTLQPYQAPMVSTPPSVQAPEIATTGPVSTVMPVQQAASELVSLTGTAMLPYTTGTGAWVTAAGMGMLAAGAIAWRRRSTALGAVEISE